MAVDATTAIAQLDSLLEKIEPRIEFTHGRWFFKAEEPERSLIRTRCLAAVDRLAPSNSWYVLDATTDAVLELDPGEGVVKLAGVLRALREDYEAGYMRTVEELIHADVFADFLEMADELHGKGYKDPAAVIAGSVLEEHLRKLAAANAVPVERADGKPRNADSINSDLAKVVYGKLDQKSVTAWLDLRNKAAHGHHDQYDTHQVDGLIRDVRAFLTRHPA